jgi:hypothetical protein
MQGNSNLKLLAKYFPQLFNNRPYFTLSLSKKTALPEIVSKVPENNVGLREIMIRVQRDYSRACLRLEGTLDPEARDFEFDNYQNLMSCMSLGSWSTPRQNPTHSE